MTSSKGVLPMRHAFGLASLGLLSLAIPACTSNKPADSTAQTDRSAMTDGSTTASAELTAPSKTTLTGVLESKPVDAAQSNIWTLVGERQSGGVSIDVSNV